MNPDRPGRFPASLRSRLTSFTWILGLAFALILAAAMLLFELGSLSGRPMGAAEIALRAAIITVSGVMLIGTIWFAAFLKTGVLQPIDRLEQALASSRKGSLGIPSPYDGRLVEWQRVSAELRATMELVRGTTEALETQSARRRKGFETLVAALEDTSLLYQELRVAYRDLADLKEVDRLRRHFVNAVSHDLRTPLSSVLGFLEFLEDEIGGPLTEQQREFVAQIRRASRRLGSLVNDLLDYAAMEAGTFTLRLQPGDLADQVREVGESLAPFAAERQVELLLDLPESATLAALDPQRIDQVLTNLIHNAVKFTPAGGTVRVAITTANDTVRCCVEDTGIGIDPEDIGKLFQGFSQLPAGRLQAGTGLGLAISRSIVEAHGGSIGVESRPGAGSEFWFTLPIDLAPRPDDAAVQPERAALPAGN
ncbi:MAG: HAMP domain-containing histidine kinase [Candidatus Sericytochromatia bacterium]|nr:HAMP domain-containing histidine kinase [Candidatus Tanganyikabacteria bacterium]